MTDFYHVYPLNDLREHVLEGVNCWCHPRIDDEDGLVVHNAADEREKYETGALICQ